MAWRTPRHGFRTARAIQNGFDLPHCWIGQVSPLQTSFDELQAGGVTMDKIITNCYMQNATQDNVRAVDVAERVMGKLGRQLAALATPKERSASI